MSPQPETSPHDPDVDEPTGPPYRAIAMVLLAAVVVAIAIGLVQLFGGDDPAPTAGESTTSQTVTTPADGGQATAQTAPGSEVPPPGATGPAPADGAANPQVPAPGAGVPSPSGAVPGDTGDTGVTGDTGASGAAVPVRVYNNSTIAGLAGRTADTLRGSGFAVADVTNYPSTMGVMPESVAFYGTGPGEQQAAEAIAAQLGIPARPRPAEVAADAQGVIVIVTQDLNR